MLVNTFKNWYLCGLATIKIEAYCSFMSLKTCSPGWLSLPETQYFLNLTCFLQERSWFVCRSGKEEANDPVHCPMLYLEGPSRAARLPTFECGLETESGKPVGTRVQQRLLSQGVYSVPTPSLCHFITALWFRAKQVGTLCLYYHKICIQTQKERKYQIHLLVLWLFDWFG